MKLCIDCKWHRQKYQSKWAQHWCSKDETINPVDGEPLWKLCQIQRFLDYCGGGGNWWEPKDGD